MIRLLFGLAALCLSPSASAQLYNIATMQVIIEPNRTLDGQTLTLTKDQPLLETTGYSPRAVRLEEDVTVGTLGSGYNLTAGSVLFGRYDDTVWTYCGFFEMNAESTVASGAALGILTAGFSLMLEPFMERGDMICLSDTDKNGKFDGGWGNSNVETKENSLLIYSLAEKKLSGEPAYIKADPADGLKMPIDLIWRKEPKSARIRFITRLGGANSSSTLADIPAAGDDPVEVDVSGVKLLLKSYNADTKTINVEIVEGFQPRYERVRSIQIITYSYY